MVTLYLDMDGVVADFDAFLYEYKTAKKKDYDADHHTLFRTLVEDEKVFEQLDTMEGAHEFVFQIRQMIRDRDVEIMFLTSVGTSDPQLAEIVAEQKNRWLRKQGFPWKAIFVRRKSEKANYATANSLLIDDRPGSVEPFRDKGGRAILHKYQEETISALNDHLDILLNR